MHDSAIFYNKIIDVEAKSNNEEKKNSSNKENSDKRTSNEVK